MTGTPPLVAHIIYALGTGGLENGLVNIINRCPAQRYRHVIICLTAADEFAQRVTVPGVEIVELHKKPGNDPGMYWRLWRVLRRLRPDIVHTRNLAAMETQALGLFMLGVKRVHGEHGRDIHDLDGSNRKYQLLRRVIRPLIHRYIAVSQDLAGWLANPIGVERSRICQIYNGVDQIKFSPTTGESSSLLPDNFLASTESIIFGTVGRLAEVKNQTLLLDALALLLQRTPQWRDKLRLILVGDGPLHEQLSAEVLAKNLSDVVWMAGDRSDIAALLNCMDIFLLPSLGEGISNTVLEAMSCGLPVVATDVGGNPELVDEGVNGYLVPVGDVEATVEAMARLVASSDLRTKMGNAGRARVDRDFAWDSTVANYLGVYDQLLGKDGPVANSSECHLNERVAG